MNTHFGMAMYETLQRYKSKPKKTLHMLAHLGYSVEKLSAIFLEIAYRAGEVYSAAALIEAHDIPTESLSTCLGRAIDDGKHEWLQLLLSSVDGEVDVINVISRYPEYSDRVQWRLLHELVVIK